MPNRLAEASSPYLKQHAGNPIDWWPWCPEAFAQAQERDVPVLLSVGYSACHWCHVMAHESFEDAEVAALVNQRFVSIKVDREERPDVDALYMKATQALTGHGGWPMTVFLTPAGQPFFAGTYYPPQRNGAMPSFSEVVLAIDEAWRERGAEVIHSAAAIVQHLADEFTPLPDPGALRVWDLMELVSVDADLLHGGFGRAPKFPAPLLIDALLVKGESESVAIAQRALEAMARGGICDQLGGGFHRYSVDAGWVVPRFEKMLYDNALLLGSYVRGWRRTADHDGSLRWLYERTIRGLVGWLEREMLLPGGGLAASLDADSSDIRGMAHEGIFYAWSSELLADALGETDASWAADTFHVTTQGTFEHGLSTLQLRGWPDSQRLDAVSQRLLEVRGNRFRPPRDDKCVAAWNGWALDSLVNAAMVFGEPRWLDVARGVAEALEAMIVDGRLRRTSLDGQVGEIAGLAEDYGAVALGLARLAGATGDGERLARAAGLLDTAVDLFGAEDGGFHDTARDAERLFVRPREVSDNPTPSGTSSLIAALRLVGLLADRRELIERADAAMATLRGIVARAPRFAGWAFTDLMIADEARQGLSPAVVVVVAEPGAEVPATAMAAWRMAPAGSAIVLGAPGTAGFAEHFVDRDLREAKPTVYVCRGVTCFAPATELAELRTALWSRA